MGDCDTKLVKSLVAEEVLLFRGRGLHFTLTVFLTLFSVFFAAGRPAATLHGVDVLEFRPSETLSQDDIC